MRNDNDGILLSSFKLLLLLCLALFLFLVEMVLIQVTLSLFGLQLTVIQTLCIALLLTVCTGVVDSAASHCRRKCEQLSGED